MTQALFLVSRSAAVGLRTLNKVQAVAINLDATSTASVVIAAAVAKLNGISAGLSSYDKNYFDTVSQISDLASGPINANNRAMVFSNDSVPLVAA